MNSALRSPERVTCPVATGRGFAPAESIAPRELTCDSFVASAAKKTRPRLPPSRMHANRMKIAATPPYVFARAWAFSAFEWSSFSFSSSSANFVRSAL